MTCEKCKRYEARIKELEEEVEELRVRDRIAYGPRVPECSIVIEEIYGESKDYSYSVGGAGGSGGSEKKDGK